MFKRIATALTALLTLVGCATSTTERLDLPPLETVQQVDIDRYLGTWYEIASFPQRFQQGCHGTTANYSLRKDGKIDVLNKCYKGSLDGELDTARGLARVVDESTNAKLKVSFFRPFWGDYWIIELGDDYEYAVVGHPGRDYLWILNREPQMAQDQYQAILARLEDVGYQTERLERTAQPESPGAATTPPP